MSTAGAPELAAAFGGSSTRGAVAVATGVGSPVFSLKSSVLAVSPSVVDAG